MNLIWKFMFMYCTSLKIYSHQIKINNNKHHYHFIVVSKIIFNQITWAQQIILKRKPKKLLSFFCPISFVF